MGRPSPRVVLATRNAHKVQELRDILRAELPATVDLNTALVGLDAYDTADVVESGVTFAENALLKAQAAAAETGLPALADDSGISVDVLGGAPGVFSARWCGRHGDDAANLQLLLDQLADVPDAHRGARFVCAMALVHPDGQQQVRLGEMVGQLTREPLGGNGFGYDPIFMPAGHQVTSAQLTPDQKHAISHRGAATRAILPELIPLFTG